MKMKNWTEKTEWKSFVLLSALSEALNSYSWKVWRVAQKARRKLTADCETNYFPDSPDFMATSMLQ